MEGMQKVYYQNSVDMNNYTFKDITSDWFLMGTKFVK